MSFASELRARLSEALAALTADAGSLANLLRPTQDARFGDYQANCAMPLAKQLGRPPREIAGEIMARMDVEDICLPPEIAGPGFINFTLRAEALAARAGQMLSDPRLLVPRPATPRTVVVDYSSPNVAKPMHVGHIRSTVIGDALARMLRFAGHRVITDNHLGDWGTQFGMVIYGYKHFHDPAAYADRPVAELSRLYRVVNTLIDYHGARQRLEQAEEGAADAERTASAAEEAAARAAKDEQKKARKAAKDARRRALALASDLERLRGQIAAVEADDDLHALARKHPTIAASVLEETAKLHAGDAENLALWKQFLPYCRQDIERVYQRLGIRFDYQLGESFYHPMLPEVVASLRSAGLATDSEGAVCVFLPDFETPMIVQKKDGAFLYATTDLATLQYRQDEFDPDEVLYVVDHRQSEHFEKLFATAARWRMPDIQLRHISFGTVLGSDGRPFKTRSGSAVGLEPLLDDAVRQASAVVCDPERISKLDPPLSAEERERIAGVVGHGAIKYADLAHHRTSDYVFDLKKMVSLEGNTSAYIQYAYARIQSILRGGGTSEEQVAQSAGTVRLDEPEERQLALLLLRFPEALEQALEDYRPNLLVDYLYDVAKSYAIFFECCPVLKADAALKESRLALCAIAARVLRQGLDLLGIATVPRM